MQRIKDIALVTGVILIIGLALALYIAALNGLKDDAEQAVINAGNTDVNVGGRDFFACSKGDAVGWHFTAVNAKDKQIEGTVCCGWLKGCTVRF